VIQRWDEMLSLTDMWKAAGKDLSKQPAKWREQEATKAFVEHLEVILPKTEDGLYQVVRRGGNEAPDTRAHWQIGLAYAKYLSPEFRLQCNTVVRERMEPGDRAVQSATGGSFEGVYHHPLGGQPLDARLEAQEAGPEPHLLGRRRPRRRPGRCPNRHVHSTRRGN
jgi:hypothetical protein